MKKLDDILCKIKHMRKAKYLTPADMAERLGVERTTYIRKESGDIPVTLKEFLLIADILNIPPEYFLNQS